MIAYALVVGVLLTGQLRAGDERYPGKQTTDNGSRPPLHLEIPADPRCCRSTIRPHRLAREPITVRRQRLLPDRIRFAARRHRTLLRRECFRCRNQAPHRLATINRKRHRPHTKFRHQTTPGSAAGN